MAEATETIPLLSQNIIQEIQYPLSDTDDMKYDTSSIGEQDSSDMNNQQHVSRNNILGMIYVTISTFLSMTAYALIKYISVDLNISLFEYMIISHFVQNLISWILWFLPVSITKKPEYIKLWYAEQEYRYSVWIRGFFYWGDLYLYCYGITLVPLGDVEVIYFLCPIFIAFGARIFLKEKFSKGFPIIFVLTIIGLIILCQPEWLVHLFGETDAAYYTPRFINVKGIIFIIFGCISWSIMTLMVRSAPKAHWIQLEITSSLQAFAIWTPFLVFVNYFIHNDYNLDNGNWQFSTEAIGFIVLIGILMCSALMFLVLGYQFGEATKVSWMEYSSIPMGFIYQWIMFGEIPNIYDVIGAVIVMSSCLIGVAEEYYNYKINASEPTPSINACDFQRHDENTSYDGYQEQLNNSVCKNTT